MGGAGAGEGLAGGEDLVLSGAQAGAWNCATAANSHSPNPEKPAMLGKR